MRDEAGTKVRQGLMRRWFSAALVVALAVLAPAMNQTEGVAAKTKAKLDRVLQRALDNEDGSRQRVIVRPRSGHSNAVTGATKVTVQKFYLPNGASTQLKGVVPDIVIPSIV